MKKIAIFLVLVMIASLSVPAVARSEQSNSSSGKYDNKKTNMQSNLEIANEVVKMIENIVIINNFINDNYHSKKFIILDDNIEDPTKRAVTKGAAAGATAGAAAGSFIPVVGTTVGFFVGGVAGGNATWWAYD